MQVEVELREIDDVSHPNFPRAFELLNKTNQYNTTGRRWAQQECAAAFAGGTRFFCFDASDKFTAYGLIGVVIVDGANIVQFVMSCRVVGMEVEIAAIAALLPIIAARTGVPAITAALTETELNLLARDLWPRCGFPPDAAGRWVRPHSPALPTPGHIKMSVAVDPRSPLPAAAE